MEAHLAVGQMICKIWAVYFPLLFLFPWSMAEFGTLSEACVRALPEQCCICLLSKRGGCWIDEAEGKARAGWRIQFPANDVNIWPLPLVPKEARPNKSRAVPPWAMDLFLVPVLRGSAFLVHAAGSEEHQRCAPTTWFGGRELPRAPLSASGRIASSGLSGLRRQ